MGQPKIARKIDAGSAGLVDTRAALAAQFIPAGARVRELRGTSLKPYLPFGCTHQSVQRDALPASAAQADIVVLFDALQKEPQAGALLGALAPIGRTLVVNFRTGGDRSSEEGRFDFYALVRLIDRFGFRIETTAPVDDDEIVIRLVPTKKTQSLAPCSVAVLNGNMTFAERLGGQMINALMPGEADVHHVNFGDLGAARDRYDLVVLGTGQGLFQPLVADEVLDVVKRARVAIGIFGTQQRDLLPRDQFGRLLDALSVWFARNQDDVMLYGRDRDNVVHLGDWLIEQCPLGQARDNELLTIGEHALSDLPLDRAVEAIQRHRIVFARSPAPLLCALTTADTVAYSDEAGPTAPAGEFRSLLLDIFGRSHPPCEYFQVDRDAVMRYRARVHGNVALMRQRIDALLRGRAAA